MSLKKYFFFFCLIAAFHAFPGQCEHHAEFSVADSLFADKQYLQAIAEYSRFLSSDKADYALYRIGLSKNEIAGFCVSRKLFDRYPDTFREKYGDRYQTYLDYRTYIEENPSQFWYFEPGAIHVSRGADFRKIISDYPESGYVDDSAL